MLGTIANHVVMDVAAAAETVVLADLEAAVRRLARVARDVRLDRDGVRHGFGDARVVRGRDGRLARRRERVFVDALLRSTDGAPGFECQVNNEGTRGGTRARVDARARWRKRRRGKKISK